MPPKRDTSSKTKKTSDASSSQSSKKENSIVLSSAGRSRNLVLTNVENGKLLSPESSELKAVAIETTAFTSISRSVSTFTLHDYRSYCNVDVAAAHLSKSKELKDNLKSKNIILKTSSTTNLVVVKDLTESTLDNVVSFNKACAIMSAGILKHTFEDEFDWEKKKYRKTDIGGDKVTVNTSYINRLAGQLGMMPGNPYYWMIVPGYEFLYELYPAEVLAYTLVRLHFRKHLNIHDSIPDTEIISSLVMKMNRFHYLEATDFDKAIETIGEDNIAIAYGAISEDIGVTSKGRRNGDAIIKFRELIAKFSPSNSAS